MILNDNLIRINLNRLGTNLNENNIQASSLDFVLSDTFAIQAEKERTTINLSDRVEYQTIQQDTVTIFPQEFILASTKEYFTMPNDIAGFVQGRSSIGRLGLFIQNAGWVDAGFEGTITLELFNASNNPIRLKAGDRIGQMVFVLLKEKAWNPYSGKYQGQNKTQPSLKYLDEEESNESSLL